jgi:hypothetical protein
MPRQRSSDLFPTDQPIPASQMIGRGTDLREIASTLVGGWSIILAGARRTGKTSVGDAVLGELERRGYYTISIDLFRIATAAESPKRSLAQRCRIARPCAERSTKPTGPGAL